MLSLLRVGSAAPAICAPSVANSLTNFGTDGDSPSISSVTRICPSHPGTRQCQWSARIFQRDFIGQFRRHPFQNNGKCARAREGFCVFFNLWPFGTTAALRFEAAHHIYILRRQADMPHYGNAALGQMPNRCFHACHLQVSPPAHRFP